jgi:hypothetical protein
MSCLCTRITRTLLLSCVSALPIVAPSHAGEILFGAAGVPKSLGQTRDYDQIFGALKGARIGLFLPTSIYQMTPQVKSLGREADFLPPCSAESPSFEALQRSGIRLVIPASLLYPLKAALPPIEVDPLRKLIACIGRANLFGVGAFDEPALQDIPVDVSQRLYERVKQIDATLPVLMVHAPLKTDAEQTATVSGRDAYLNKVLGHSQYADIVGFDLYAVPQWLARIKTPVGDDQSVDYAAAARDYMAWLRRELPDKRYLAVLQGFSYSDQYETSALRQFDEATLSRVRPPTEQELREMVQLSIDGGATVVFWWGESLLPNEASLPWPDLLRVTKSFAAP